MNNRPKISIVVPVYKAEAYLQRCVDSILAQTLKDWELILVDDGSPDNSGTLCDNIAASNPERLIKVIHKTNGGVSSAREAGMQAAAGVYSIHVDPDDWIDSDMLMMLYNKAISTDADIVVCDFLLDYGARQVVSSQKPDNSIPYLRQLLMQETHGSLCNKLIKKELYRLYDIHFPLDILCWEDLFVCCILVMNDCKMEYVSKAFYHYDLHSNGNSMARKVSRKTVEGMRLFCKYFESRLPIEKQAWLFGAKASVLVSQYRSGLFSAEDIRNTYPEINNEFICQYKSEYSKVLYCSTAMVLEGFGLNTSRLFEKYNNYFQKILIRLKKLF